MQVAGGRSAVLHFVPPSWMKSSLLVTALPTPIPVQGPGSAAKKRRALLVGLAGSYGEVAAGGSGSHFVEKCYALAVRHSCSLRGCGGFSTCAGQSKLSTGVQASCGKRCGLTVQEVSHRKSLQQRELAAAVHVFKPPHAFTCRLCCFTGGEGKGAHRWRAGGGRGAPHDHAPRPAAAQAVSMRQTWLRLLMQSRPVPAVGTGLCAVCKSCPN